MTDPAWTGYPATFELAADDRVANWRPLVQWFLAIPHLFIGYVLQQIANLVSLIAWLVILFTGSLPSSLANYLCLAIRYQMRTYTYVLWLRESYPPFDFSATTDDPGIDVTRIDFRPTYEQRNRLTVGLRLIWVIPAALVGVVVALGAMFVAIAGFFAVLFTGRWPEGMRAFLLKVMRFSVRVTAYTYLLTDDYPPLALDER